MAEALRRLREEHANMAKVLRALDRQIVLAERGEAPDYERIRRILDYCLGYPAICHHPKEDMIYRRLHARDPAAAKTIGDLLSEHELLESKTCRFRLLIGGAVKGAGPPPELIIAPGRDLLAFYRHHMESEEEQFFPLALKLLADKDWAEIDAQITNPKDPLFGEEIEAEYAALRNEILGLPDSDPANRSATAFDGRIAHFLKATIKRVGRMK